MVTWISCSWMTRVSRLWCWKPKRESIDPLAGKEQARKYAKAQHCRFILLSNGNQHYFWDTEIGSPHIISRFPEPGEVTRYTTFKPNPDMLVKEIIEADYIALTQRPDYAKTHPGWMKMNGRNSLKPTT